MKLRIPILAALSIWGCLPDAPREAPETGAGGPPLSVGPDAGGSGAIATAADDPYSADTPASGTDSLSSSSGSRPSAAEAPSHGGTLTFQSMGSAGWYPSSRDPASGACDAYQAGKCCMARHDVADGGIAPWDEELILTLRGPMLVERLAVFQPDPADASSWTRASYWNIAQADAGENIAFQGDGVPDAASGFSGGLGNKCILDVSTARKFPCGPGSVPYCSSTSPSQRYGWEGSKLFLMLASMPHFGSAALADMKHCSTDPDDNWYDAPWIGFSHGELIRAGKFGGCNCYAKDPAHWELADGCGQFNAFETVNDSNSFRNLGVFSTNLFGYGGYVGEGPCGTACNTAVLDPAVDLILKSGNREAEPAVAVPGKASGAAFRRPAEGYRWFLILLDAKSRTVQMALIHPDNPPPVLASISATMPTRFSAAEIGTLVSLRLPAPVSTSIRRH